MSDIKDELEEIASKLRNWMGYTNQDTFYMAVQKESAEQISTALFEIENLASSMRQSFGFHHSVAMSSEELSFKVTHYPVGQKPAEQEDA